MRYAHDMPFGAQVGADGSTSFRLWAPGAGEVELELLGPRTRGRLPMLAGADGWFGLVASDAPAGTRYRFILESGLRIPDPASRLNPLDVHGPSEVVDPLDYVWHDVGWQGRPWEEAVIYEMHVGAFTPEGSFQAAAARLDALAAIGFTTIELMPVSDFPGKRNWGYDGVLPFAPDASYGRPEDLKALIDHAHGLGLMVLLDVVYNHFGPEGNYLHAYSPQFFDASRHTPWGAAIDFAGNRTVRDFFIHNALYWIEEYRFDGLRLDAIHAIDDRSLPDIVRELSTAVREGPGLQRDIHIVLENDRNDATLLERDAAGNARFGSAQWNDDLHHALHVLLTDETDGYYADYADAPLASLGRALAEGFVYQGQPSAFRDGQARGMPSAALSPPAFVSFLQTHDQVGNRALGERLHALAPVEREDVALAGILLAPQIPMLFMGEEWAASTPFLFFCDFGPDLAQAVADGRRREFGAFSGFSDDTERARALDPGSLDAFTASKLDWGERGLGRHGERLSLVRTLLASRHAHLVPRLAGMGGCSGRFQVTDGALEVCWTLADASSWQLRMNFGDTQVILPAPPAGQLIHAHGGAQQLPDARLRMPPASVHVLMVPAREGKAEGDGEQAGEGERRGAGAQDTADDLGR